MKLIRFGAPGQERPGLIDPEGRLRDLSAHVADIAGDALSPASLARLAALDPASLPAVAGHPRLGPCVGQIGKFVCVGLNYSDHAAESNMPVPTEPVLFFKATSAVCGPNDDVEIPPGAEKVDWEVELGVVIGKTARYVSKEEALDHVAGYCIVNDVSERAYQLERGGQWDKGKGCDTFGPIGPYLVTQDEVGDVQNLDMWLKVNGEIMQKGNTRTMIFSCHHIVAYCSQFMTLNPGDIITTGTPPGVGMGMKPPKFLQVGDAVELGIEKLGTQRQVIRAHP